MGRCPDLQGLPVRAVALPGSFSAPPTGPFRDLSRVFLTRPGGARSRCPAAASFMVLGSSCESAPSISSRVASSRDGSLEVRRLHSARGSADRNRVLRPDSIRLLGSSHMTACSRLGPAGGSFIAGCAHEIPLSKLAPARIGAGSPAHALLRFHAGLPLARTRAASGLRSPDGVARDHGVIAGGFLRVPL